ncbi:hypothetical protein M427DRAFT_30897 [Gonapodya prolifera JEL478]|uniref:Uncharacterized protein n=1 Tax=Gonapodya prolifera (strain JEL478) TaxID=1344416 RepID=A0A139AJP7_GONPJ|nr:hypothetical protein M427DRAFT_30897 [Gonapodya prolifera JEL478]|eukprot:KXS16774.1 hypothetical protein M427DRAFT_30897 [Gonapodya prolifera JEL478]
MPELRRPVPRQLPQYSINGVPSELRQFEVMGIETQANFPVSTACSPTPEKQGPPPQVNMSSQNPSPLEPPKTGNPQVHQHQQQQQQQMPTHPQMQQPFYTFTSMPGQPMLAPPPQMYGAHQQHQMQFINPYGAAGIPPGNGSPLPMQIVVPQYLNLNQGAQMGSSPSPALSTGSEAETPPPRQNSGSRSSHSHHNHNEHSYHRSGHSPRSNHRISSPLPSSYLRSQLSTLESDLDSSVHQIITALRDRVIELEAQQLTSNMDLQKLSRATTQKEIVLQETTKKIVELEKERRRSENQLNVTRERTQQEINDREHRIIQLEEKLRNAESAANSLDELLRSRDSIAHEAETTARVAAERAQTVNSLTATLESRQTKLHKLARAVKSLKLSLRAEKEAGAERERVIEEERDRVNQQYVRACEKIARLEATVQDRDTTIARRDRAIVEAETRISGLQTQLQQNETALADLKKAFTDAVGTLAERKRIIRDLERQIEESGRALQEKETVVNEANKLASERAEQVADMAKRMAELELTTGEAKDKSAALELELEKFKEALSEVNRTGNAESQSETIRDATQLADALEKNEGQAEQHATPTRKVASRPQGSPHSENRPQLQIQRQGLNGAQDSKAIQSPTSASTAVASSPSRSTNGASPGKVDQTDYIVKSDAGQAAAERATASQLHDMQKKYADLEVRTKAELTLKDSEIVALEERVKNLKKDLRTANEKLSAIPPTKSSDATEQAPQSGKPLQSEVVVRNNNGGPSKTTDGADDDRQVLQDIIKSLEAALKVAQAEIQATHAERSQAMVGTDKELIDYKRKCDEYKNVCDEYKNVCEQLNAKVAELEGKLARERQGDNGPRGSPANSAAMQAQSDQLRKARLRIAELEQSLADAPQPELLTRVRSKVNELEKKVEELQAQLRDASDMIARRDQAFRDVTQASEERAKQIADITSRLVYAEEVIQDREAAIDERDKLLGQLNTRIQAQGGDANAAGAAAQRNIDLENAIAERDAKLNELTMRLREVSPQDPRANKMAVDAAMVETRKILMELAKAKQEAGTEVAKIKAEASKLALERDRKISMLERNLGNVERDVTERDRLLNLQHRAANESERIDSIRNEAITAMTRRIFDLSRVLAGQDLPAPLIPTNPDQWQSISSANPELANLVSGIAELESTLQATAEANRSGNHVREGSQGSVTSIHVGPDGAPVKRRRPSFFKKISTAFKRKDGETGW